MHDYNCDREHVCSSDSNIARMLLLFDIFVSNENRLIGRVRHWKTVTLVIKRFCFLPNFRKSLAYCIRPSECIFQGNVSIIGLFE